MNKPTEAQVKEFWERYGFEIFEQDTRFEHQVLYRLSPTDTWKHLGEVSLDLNNLFKYAVPKLRKDKGLERIEFIFGHNTYGCFVRTKYWLVAQGEGQTPALALFWALHSIIDKTP